MGNRATDTWAKIRAAEATRECPRCRRPPGRPCRNMRSASWRREEDLALPHKERIG